MVVLVSSDQVLLDLGMEWYLAVGVLLRCIKNLSGAMLAEKITDQNAICPVDKGIQRQGLLPLNFITPSEGWLQPGHKPPS